MTPSKYRRSFGAFALASGSIAWRATLPLATTLITTGCSFLFVHGPPDHPSHSRVVDCTSSRLAPILDTIFATGEVVRIGVDIAASDDAFASAPIKKDADIGLGAVFGGLFLSSAVYGYIKTARCSEAVRGQSDDSSSSTDESDESDESTATAAKARKGERAGAVEPPVNRARVQNGFDFQAARMAMTTALGRAAQACGAPNGLRGQGTVTMTYKPDGHIENVVIAPPFVDSTVDSCVANVMLEASVSPYGGEPVTVRKQFDFRGGPKAAGSGSSDGGTFSPDGAPTGP
jgi:hypothetical protein